MIDRLFFVRHGQSTANKAHIYAGQRADIQLTDLGRQQAAAAADIVKPWDITAIVSSDLDRARETARIIAAGLGFAESQLRIDGLLREINPGTLTGQPENGFVSYLKYVAGGTDPTAETPDDVARRLERFLKEVAAMDGGHLLVVAHAGVGRIFQSLLTDVPLAELAEQSVVNAQPFELPLGRLHTILRNQGEPV